MSVMTRALATPPFCNTTPPLLRLFQLLMRGDPVMLITKKCVLLQHWGNIRALSRLWQGFATNRGIISDSYFRR